MPDHALSPSPVSVWARYRKAFAALIGVATPAGLVGVLALVGVDLSPELAAWLIGVGTAIVAPAAVLGAPANVEPTAEPPEAVQ